MNLHFYGNTSAASIPILLDEMNKEGMLNKGDKIILQDLAQALPGEPLCWNGKIQEDKTGRQETEL